MSTPEQKRAEENARQLIPDSGTARTPTKPARRRMFDPGFLFVAAVMFTSAFIVYERKGLDHVLVLLGKGSGLMGSILPKIAAAVLIAAWLRRLLPKEMISRHFGQSNGLKGMTLAVLAGVILPGGPMTAFPLAVTFFEGGAAISVIVAFVSSWLLISSNRIIVWEMAFLDTSFVGWRLLYSLTLPFLLGWAAHYLFAGKALIPKGER